MQEESVQTSRRKFLGHVGVAGAATLAAGVVGVEPLLHTERSTPNRRASPHASCAAGSRSPFADPPPAFAVVSSDEPPLVA